MRIIDCFTFFNELDLLRLRLEELRNVVDHFVLSEATHSHSGRKKPLYFAEGREAFSDFGERLTSHVADLSAIQSEDRWVREHAQRDAVTEALKGIELKPDDLILLSDVDEIPRASSIRTAKQVVEREGAAVFEQTLHRFYLNNVTVAFDNRCGWCGTLAVRYQDLLETSASRLRGEWCSGGQLSRHAARRQRRALVTGGGWHLTYMGGRQAVVYKRQNFAHAEGDDPTLATIPSWAPGDRHPQTSAARCQVFGGACPCGCTWGSLPQAYDTSEEGVSLKGLDLPDYLVQHKEQFAPWVRSTDRERPADPLPGGAVECQSVILVIAREESDPAHLRDVIEKRSPSAEQWWVADIRPETHSVPEWVENAGRVHWFRFPSRTPGRALNALLNVAHATEILRWQPGTGEPWVMGSSNEILKIGGYSERLPAHQDWDLFLRLRGGLWRASWPSPRNPILAWRRRRSPFWEAQLHAMRHIHADWTASQDRSAVLQRLSGWLLRIWMAKERCLAGQFRTALRDLITV